MPPVEPNLIDSPTDVEVIFPAQGIDPAWAQAHERVNQIRGYLIASFAYAFYAGELLRTVWAHQEWKLLGLANFADYCAQFGISKSEGYDLVQIVDLRDQFPAMYPKMLEAGKSKMRLLLPHTLEVDEPKLDDMLDDATELSWRDLRQKYNGDDHEHEQQRGLIQKECPHCHRPIWLSRESDVHGKP